MMGLRKRRELVGDLAMARCLLNEAGLLIRSIPRDGVSEDLKGVMRQVENDIRDFLEGKK